MSKEYIRSFFPVTKDLILPPQLFYDDWSSGFNWTKVDINGTSIITRDLTRPLSTPISLKIALPSHASGGKASIHRYIPVPRTLSCRIIFAIFADLSSAISRVEIMLDHSGDTIGGSAEVSFRGVATTFFYLDVNSNYIELTTPNFVPDDNVWSIFDFACNFKSSKYTHAIASSMVFPIGNVTMDPGSTGANESLRIKIQLQSEVNTAANVYISSVLVLEI